MNNMIEFIIFFIRYIPFWCVPVILICMPFAYIFWLKDVRLLSYCFTFISFIALFLIVFWVWAGGPDLAVQFFFEGVRNY